MKLVQFKDVPHKGEFYDPASAEWFRKTDFLAAHRKADSERCMFAENEMVEITDPE